MSYLSYTFVVKILEDEVVKHLETTAQLTKQHIENVLSEQKEKIETTMKRSYDHKPIHLF